MIDAYTVEAIDGTAALRNAEFVLEWDALLDRHRNLNVMYASSKWVGHLVATSGELVRLWLIRDHEKALVGLAAARIGEFNLQFAVKNRVLLSKSLTVAHLLGSLPVLPDTDGVLELIVSRILKDWPQCQGLYLDALPTDSTCWRRVQNLKTLAVPVMYHVVSGPRPWHLLDLQESFESYLKTLSPKSRATLRRKSRQAGTTSHGPAKVTRVSTAEDVGEFLRGAVEVSRQSWQHRILGERVRSDEAAQRSFEDLAFRGILRSYLLELGSLRCAFVIGYQHDGVFHYAELGFREDCSELSPGTVLLFQIVEDLHSNDSPRTLNFGVGDASYKRRFGNRESSDLSCLILRRTLGTRLLTAGHWGFNQSVTLAKKMLVRKAAAK